MPVPMEVHKLDLMELLMNYAAGWHKENAYKFSPQSCNVQKKYLCLNNIDKPVMV